MDNCKDAAQGAFIDFDNRLRAVGMEASKEDYFRAGHKFGEALARLGRSDEVAILKAEVTKLRNEKLHLNYELNAVKSNLFNALNGGPYEENSQLALKL